MHSLNILNHLTHQAGEEGVFLIAVYAWCIRCLEIHFKLYGHTFVTMKYYEEKKHIFPLMWQANYMQKYSESHALLKVS